MQISPVESKRLTEIEELIKKYQFEMSEDENKFEHDEYKTIKKLRTLKL